jgi:hypothetical protein
LSQQESACREQCESCQLQLKVNKPLAKMNENMQGHARPPGAKIPKVDSSLRMRRQDQPHQILRPAVVTCGSSAHGRSCPDGQVCARRRDSLTAASSNANETAAESWCVGQTCFLNPRDESKKRRCPEGQQCVRKPWLKMTDVEGMCADKNMQCTTDSDCGSLADDTSRDWQCEKRPAGDGALCRRGGACGLCMHSVRP